MPNFRRLIWMPRDLASSDQRQRDFVTHLNEDAGTQNGADLLNGNIEELKTVIHETLADIRKRNDAAAAKAGGRRAAWPPRRRGRLDDPIRVYIMCEPADRKSPAIRGAAEIPAKPKLRAGAADLRRRRNRALQIHIENFVAVRRLPHLLRRRLDGVDRAKAPRPAQTSSRAPAADARQGDLHRRAADRHKSDLETLEALGACAAARRFRPHALEPFMQRIQRRRDHEDVMPAESSIHPFPGTAAVRGGRRTSVLRARRAERGNPAAAAASTASWP